MNACSICGELITEEIDLPALLDWWEKLIKNPATPLPDVKLSHRCKPKERLPVAPIQVKDAMSRRQDMKERAERYAAHIRNVCKDYKIKVQYRFNCGSAALGMVDSHPPNRRRCRLRSRSARAWALLHTCARRICHVHAGT